MLLHLGDLAFGFRHGRHQLALLPTQPGGFPLERRHFADGDKLLLPKLADAVQLFDDEFNFGIFGCNLGVEPTNLLTQLRGAFVQLLLLPISRVATKLEVLLLSRQHLLDHRI